MTKLLGCPFCGGKATTYEYQSRYLAQCDSCSFALTPEEWNRRAESDREAVLTHQLELRVQELDATADILEQTRRENADLLAALKELLDAHIQDGVIRQQTVTDNLNHVLTAEQTERYVQSSERVMRAEEAARAAIARHS